MGALSTPGAKVVMAGNPTRTSGFFYDTHHSLRHRWHTLPVSCLDVPRAQGRVEDIKAKYGEGSNTYRVRVLILIDAIGLGAGVYDRCKELGLPVRAINVGEAACVSCWGELSI